MSEVNNEEYSYLDIPTQDVAWCKINEAGELEFIRWDIIEIYAAQYDADKAARDQTRVMCKLLVLVRDQTRKEVEREQGRTSAYL